MMMIIIMIMIMLSVGVVPGYPSWHAIPLRPMSGSSVLVLRYDGHGCYSVLCHWHCTCYNSVQPSATLHRGCSAVTTIPAMMMIIR
eukprot:2666673-Rhodomonas_salina.3